MIDKLERECKNKQDIIFAKDQQIEDLRNEMKSKEKTYNDMKNAFINLQNSVADQFEQINDKKQHITELYDVVGQLKDKNDDVSKELRALYGGEIPQKLPLDEKDKEIIALKSRIAILESDDALSHVCSERDDIDKKYKSLVTKTNNLEKENAEIKEALSLASPEVTNESLRQENMKMRSTLAVMMKKVKESEEKLQTTPLLPDADDLLVELQRRSDRIKELEEKLEGNEQTLDQNVKAEQTPQVNERGESSKLSEILSSIEQKLLGEDDDFNASDMPIEERVVILNKKVDSQILEKQNELEAAENKARQLEADIKKFEDALNEATNPVERKAIEKKIDQLKAELEQTNKAKENTQKQIDSLQKLKQVISNDVNSLDAQQAMSDKLLSVTGDFLEDEIIHDLLLDENNSTLPLSGQVAQVFANIYKTNAKIHGLDLEETFEVTDQQSLKGAIVKFARLFTRIKKQLGTSNCQPNFRDFGFENINEPSMRIKYQNLEEHTKKLTRNYKVALKKLKEHQKNEASVTKLLLCSCPSLSKSVPSDTKLFELVKHYVAQFPIHIVSTIQQHVEQIFDILLNASNQLSNMLDKALEHCSHAAIKANQHSQKFSSETSKQLIYQSYDKTLKCIFPPSANVTPVTNVREIQRRLMKTIALLRSGLQLIPGSKMPSHDNIYSYAVLIRRNLSSNTVLDASSDFSTDLSLSELALNGENPLASGRFSEYEKQVNRLMDIVNHSISYKNLVTALSDVLDLEVAIEPNEITEQTVADLFQAVREKVEDKEGSIEKIKERHLQYKKLVGKFFEGLKGKLPSQTSKLVDDIMNFKL
ncbi:hypothetical protein TRFO_26199 [Tritrichomonas foetus]|uniref:Dynein associated protein domain-containing protein n=1 Tax=Tritrichomonas foetus TaxID=1144522 RepID=A0A1J4K881_9EUKA|nr:hypothetical protein TRFO_26199 [Tritrichomonas foetus]|eukprot:OHT05916.1 hypothetical protein TRFO_26199 [Tritrichomonas foetus]